MSSMLSRVIDEAGKSTVPFATADGSRLLLFPYGARVLGLFALESEENFFWTNPVLDQTETAKALFGSSGWHNTGGDRTWIAPEVDTFFANLEGAPYFQPRALDMSDYTVERTGGGCRMSRDMTLHLGRPNCDVALRLSKWFGPAPNPLRRQREMATVASAVQYAGYTQRIVMQLLEASAPPATGLGLWNLVQLPPGGQMLIPLYSRSAPQKCFGDVPAECMTLEDHLLRIKVDFPGSHKIALKAAGLCGRAGYAYGRDGRWSLIVRNFFVNPSGEYIDVQRFDPGDFGYAFQMCRVDETEFGSFCELEYHAPTVGELPDPPRGEDVSQIWAFRGPREAIDAVARKLLGAGL
jgi:hypothetical protein